MCVHRAVRFICTRMLATLLCAQSGQSVSVSQLVFDPASWILRLSYIHSLQIRSLFGSIHFHCLFVHVCHCTNVTRPIRTTIRMCSNNCVPWKWIMDELWNYFLIGMELITLSDALYWILVRQFLIHPLSYVTNSTWNQVTDKYTCYVILIGIK